MSKLRQRLHNMVVQAQISGYQRRETARAFADRQALERLELSRAGIKGYPRA